MAMARPMGVKLAAILGTLALVVSSCSTPDPNPPALIGDWEMTGGTLAGAAFPLVEGNRITISFSPDGSVGGVAACNSYGGSYVADGEDLIIGEDIASTAMACEREVMESEQAFLSALRFQGPLTYTRTPDTLTVEGPDAMMEFSAIVPVPQAELIGTTWVLETLISGQTATAATGEPATLLLTSAGRIRASTGCRTLGGEYIVDGDSVRFTTFGAQGDCPAVLADQDSAVVSVLGDGFTVNIEGDLLTLSSQGDESLVYRRSDGGSAG